MVGVPLIKGLFKERTTSLEKTLSQNLPWKTSDRREDNFSMVDKMTGPNGLRL